jgi:hypothetical protein
MIGFFSRAAWRQAAAISGDLWPSPIAAVQSPLLPVTQYGVSGGSRLRIQTVLDGIARDLAVRANQEASAVLTYNLLFQGFEATWADALGYMGKRVSSTVQPETLATGVYRHRFGIDPCLWADPWTMADGFQMDDGLLIDQRKTRRGTLALDFADIGVWELASAMVASWELRSDAFGWFLTVGYIGHAFSLTSATNTLTLLRSLTRDTAEEVSFTAATLRLAPYSSSTALNSSNLVEFSSLQLRCDNRLRSVQSRQTSLATEEPRRSEIPAITGELLLPYYANNTLFTAQRAGTHYMAELRVQGSIIGSGIPYAFAILLPDILLTSIQTTGSGSADAPGLQIIFQCRIPEVASAGFPVLATQTPIIIELVNTIAAHPLL